MFGLKSYKRNPTYDLVIDVIPLEKQFELIELYDTIEDYMLLEQITGIDALHIKLILHRKRIILNRRGRNPGKYMDAADLILLEWIKYNIRSEKDISKYKIYKEVEHLKALLDIPRYHVRKQTWQQINSIILDNLKITNSKENYKLNIYGIIKTCGEYILEPNAYRKFMYSAEQNTFIRVKEEDTNTAFDKTVNIPDQMVQSKEIENCAYKTETPEKIVDQSVISPNLILVEKPVVDMGASNYDDTNKSESKTDSSFKLNDESIKKNSSSLEESNVRLVRSPDLNILENPVIQKDVSNEDSVKPKTESKSETSFKLNDENMKKSSLTLEESEMRTLRPPDLNLIEKPIIEIDIIDADVADNIEIESDSSFKLNDENMKESSLSLEESEERVLASPDLILIEKPIVQIDISNDDDDEKNKEMESNSKNKLNAECKKGSVPSLEEREKSMITSPDLILIEKSIVQIDISDDDDDDENNKEMKSDSKDKLNDNMKECSLALEVSDERVLSSPDLVLIEKPIVHIDISNDDDGSNAAIKSDSKDLTFLSPMERNPKILKRKPAKCLLQSVDFEDPVPVKKEREELNCFKDILDISNCNNDYQSNGSALDVLNTPVVDVKQNSQFKHRSTKTTSAKESNVPGNFKVSHSVLVDKEPEGLDNFVEFQDISKHNDDCKLNGSTLDIVNKSVVDVKQEFGNGEQNLQFNRKVTKTKSAKRSVERVNFKVSHSGPINKKAEGLNSLEDCVHISKHNNNRQSNGYLTMANTQIVDIKKDCQSLAQNRTECTEFSTTNYATQRDKSLDIEQHISEFKLVQEAKSKYSTDCVTQTVKKEYDHEIQEEKVKPNEVLNRIEEIQEVKNTETQNNNNNIDTRENSDEDNIEIVFEIEDDDGNVQIEFLEISNK